MQLYKSFAAVAASFCLFISIASAQQAKQISPGVWQLTYGEQEKVKPSDFKEAPLTVQMQQLPGSTATPAILKNTKFSDLAGGVVAELDMDEAERIYGFGLQVNTFEQRGMRREVRTNSWIVGNVGFSHAPMPFYISSKGYGVLVNSSRYVNFYVGSTSKLLNAERSPEERSTEPGSTLAALYNKNQGKSNRVQIQVKGAKGMEILVFDGPTMMQVMQRYNLYSGGGAIPPLWGLGFKYRAKNTFTAAEATKFSEYFRENHIPCDMFGLEPGWHQNAYSCSYTWNKKKYPNPDSVLDVMHKRHYKLNLWEHAYVHPTSPIFPSIIPFSGDYAVWKGAVPDFTLPQARKVFGDYHNQTFIKKGISAFKLDECDAAYYHEAGGEWSFPDIAKFPSGLDGEQYRQIFGLLYQKTLLEEYKKENKRTMFEVRASYLFAAPYAAALYTDMYNNTDFVRMITNSGFAGVNWSPEVRQTSSEADLIRRIQTSMMSSHMNVDCWFLKNLPWYQFNREKNNNDEFLPNAKELEKTIKKIIELRMSLIPYLYAAYSDYHYKGTPPFRALVMDYPEDDKAWKVDNQYMMGNGILCAPFIDGASTREVYLPKGTWFDYNTNKKYEGGKAYSITMSLEELPMFIKEGTILPLAKSVEFITPETVFDITCKVYGNANNKSVNLFEDDGHTFGYDKNQFNRLTLTWSGNKGKVQRQGTYKKKLYRIASWQQIN